MCCLMNFSWWIVWVKCWWCKSWLDFDIGFEFADIDDWSSMVLWYFGTLVTNCWSIFYSLVVPETESSSKFYMCFGSFSESIFFILSVSISSNCVTTEFTCLLMSGSSRSSCPSLPVVLSEDKRCEAFPFYLFLLMSRLPCDHWSKSSIVWIFRYLFDSKFG